MLIDSLTFTLEKSGCLDAFWGKLDAGEDGTLGVASSARPFLVAARFAHKPQPTLVVVAGEDAAVAFSRSLAAYLGDERVMRFPERSDYPFVPKPSDPAQVARRMEAVHALASGREVVVVASARALVRALPPAGSDVHVPVALSVGRELAAMPGAQAASVTEFEDFAHALEERGYRNTGELDGPGTFAVRGGTIDVFPGNLVYPVRLDFFGDELEEIRRIVPTTGQTIQALPDVSIYPVVEFSCSKRGLARARQKLERPAATNPVLRDVLEKLDGGLRFDGSDMLLPYLYATTSTLGDYVRPGALSVLLEPRSLFDDMSHAYDDAAGRAKGSSIPVDGLYAEPGSVSFGEGQRATYVSIMRVGGHVDDELPVKRVEVAGHPDKLFGRLRSLVDTDYTVVFSASNFRARQDMKLAFVDHGLPIQETLDAEEDADELEGIAKRRLRRGVVNVVDVDVPLGMIIPKAKLAIVSLADTQGASTSRPSRHVDITEITFPYQPGDYVVHAAHGVAYFKELVRRDVDGTARDYLLLEYSEGDKLYVPVEQLDRVTRYVGPEGASPRLTRLNTADWSRALAKARKATKKLAFDLVDVYARRASVQGYRFGPDTAAQREMEEALRRVTAAAGEARVGVAHGQMSKEQLERVMEDFSAGELDVLVATTIIESGIDNPHTNTLIIEDSQRYGLAQMYQLKGRVGRSCTQAYAYFMFPEHMELTEEAAARLTALNEHTDLGSGMRIAMRDLEIRGAGSLLGAEQSGNMSAVGFDLFAQMLNQAVSATREGDLKAMDALPPALSDITVNVPGHTYLPEEYVPDADERVLWYRRIASAATEQAVEDVRADLADKRPDMPQAAKNLLEKARIKAYANEHHIKTVSVTAGKLVVEPVDVPRDKMTGLRRAGGRYLADKRKLSLPLRYFKLDEGDNLLAPVAEFLEELAK